MKRKFLPLVFIFFYFSTLSIMAEVPKWEYLVLSLGKNYFYSLPTEAIAISSNYGFKTLAYLKEGFYKIDEATTTQKQMDVLGKNGWELVDIVGVIGGDQQYVFKRPLIHELYTETLKQSDSIYNKIIKNIKNPKPTNNPIKLIEFNAYQAKLERQRITQEKKEYIAKQLAENNKYNVIEYYFKKSTNDIYPDMTSIDIDATDSLLFDGNKYRQNEADQIAKEAKNYFDSILKNVGIIFVDVIILLDGKKNTVADTNDTYN